MPSTAFQEAVAKFKRDHAHGNVEDRRDRAGPMGRPHILRCDNCGTESSLMLDPEDTAGA